LKPELQRICELIRSGELVTVAEQAVGALH
jgi:hypothetical protein